MVNYPAESFCSRSCPFWELDHEVCLPCNHEVDDDKDTTTLKQNSKDGILRRSSDFRSDNRDSMQSPVVFPAQPGHIPYDGGVGDVGQSGETVAAPKSTAQSLALRHDEDPYWASAVGGSAAVQNFRQSQVQCFSELIGKAAPLYRRQLNTKFIQGSFEQQLVLEIIVFDEVVQSLPSSVRYVAGIHPANVEKSKASQACFLIRIDNPDRTFWPKGSCDRPHMKLILVDTKGTTAADYTHMSSFITIGCPDKLEFRFPDKEEKHNKVIQRQQREPLSKLHTLLREAPPRADVQPVAIKRTSSQATSTVSNSTAVTTDAACSRKTKRSKREVMQSQPEISEDSANGTCQDPPSAAQLHHNSQPATSTDWVPLTGSQQAAVQQRVESAQMTTMPQAVVPLASQPIQPPSSQPHQQLQFQQWQYQQQLPMPSGVQQPMVNGYGWHLSAMPQPWGWPVVPQHPAMFPLGVSGQGWAVPTCQPAMFCSGAPAVQLSVGVQQPVQQPIQQPPEQCLSSNNVPSGEEVVKSGTEELQLLGSLIQGDDDFPGMATMATMAIDDGVGYMSGEVEEKKDEGGQDDFSGFAEGLQNMLELFEDNFPCFLEDDEGLLPPDE